MAQSFIPTSDTPFYIQRTTLEGREYLLKFVYNDRESVYYLSVLDTANNPIKVGIKLVTNWPLLRKYKYDPLLPPGEFYAISLIGDAPAAFGEIGDEKRVRLIYFDSDELIDVGAPVGAAAL